MVEIVADTGRPREGSNIVTRASYTLAWLMIALSAAVVAQEPVAELVGPVTDFEEVFQEEVPVSGRVVTGIGVTGSAAMEALAVLPPGALPAAGSNGDLVCIEVVSRDGQYHSRNTYRLPSPIQDWPVRLQYPSGYTAFLEDQGAEDLAVLGSPGDCDSADRDTFYVTGSGPANATPASISIFVNSGRTDTYVAVRVDGARRGRPKRCTPIDAERRTGFDTLCEVEITGDSRDGDGLSLEILRRRYEQMLPPTEFKVVLPGSK